MCVVCVYTCMYFIYTYTHIYMYTHICVYIIYISLFFSFYGDFRYEEVLQEGASKNLFSLVLIKYFMSFKDFILK